MRATGHEVDAGARTAFFATEVARFDQQTAACGKRQRTGRFTGDVAAARVVERTCPDRDRAQRAQDDVGRLALLFDFTFENDSGAEGAGIDRARRRSTAEQLRAVVAAVAAAALYDDGQRIEQQHAIASACGAGVGPAAVEQGELARHFHLAAVAALAATARPDVARKSRRLIGPHHHLAAIAFEQCIGQQTDLRTHPGDLRVAHTGVGALPVAARQHRAAAAVAGCIECCVALEYDRFGGDYDLPALAGIGWRRLCRRTCCGDRQFEIRRCIPRGSCRFFSRCRRVASGGAQRAFDSGALHRCDGDRSTAGAAGIDLRTAFDLYLGRTDVDLPAGTVRRHCLRFGLSCQRDGLRSSQHDATVRPDMCACCADLASLRQCRAEHADIAAAGDQLAEVDGLAARFDLHPQRRLVGIRDLDALACSEHDVAIFRRDDAGVFDIARDEDQRSARGSERAFVAQLACRAVGVEFHPSGEKVFGLDVERRCHQPGGIDLCTGAEQHAVGIDEEDAAVGDEVAENLRRILTHHAVEYRCGRAGLDEAGRFTRLDRELLPVDDRSIAGRDVQRRTLLLNADLAMDDLMTARVCDDQPRQGCRKCRDHAPQRSRAAALAACLGFFRNRHVSALLFGKNQSVAPLVHFDLKFFSVRP